jgi:hypothetical protein
LPSGVILQANVNKIVVEALISGMPCLSYHRWSWRLFKAGAVWHDSGIYQLKVWFFSRVENLVLRARSKMFGCVGGGKDLGFSLTLSLVKATPFQGGTGAGPYEPEYLL